MNAKYTKEKAQEKRQPFVFGSAHWDKRGVDIIVVIIVIVDYDLRLSHIWLCGSKLAHLPAAVGTDNRVYRDSRAAVRAVFQIGVIFGALSVVSVLHGARRVLRFVCLHGLSVSRLLGLRVLNGLRLCVLCWLRLRIL